MLITKLKNKSNFKVGIASKVRGVVECKNCQKPRCIFSHFSVSHMRVPLPLPVDGEEGEATHPMDNVHQYQAQAKARLIDAMMSPIFMCGMAPLDSDDPFYDIFLADPSLDCDKHIEAEFYVSRIEPTRLEICCHCAGLSDSPIDLNNSLKAHAGPFSIVLPICKACIESGCHVIVRSARANAKAMHARLEQENAREAPAAREA